MAANMTISVRMIDAKGIPFVERYSARKIV
jgi:hypothetical protein